MGFHGSDSQLTLTPLQRQIIDAERVRRSERKQEQRDEMMNQQGGGQDGGQRPMNSRAGGGDSHSQSETVRYINRQENPDYEFPDEQEQDPS